MTALTAACQQQAVPAPAPAPPDTKASTLEADVAHLKDITPQTDDSHSSTTNHRQLRPERQVAAVTSS
jgi:hypothetical protein